MSSIPEVHSDAWQDDAAGNVHGHNARPEGAQEPPHPPHPGAGRAYPEGTLPGLRGDVRRDWPSLDPTQKSASHSGSNELSRVARGVFVGRGPELEKLRKAFDEAFSGRGNLAMLVGEPGIGKTRAAQELETYAKMRGAQVLWGRAHEASGAPAYWPWVQAGRQWASTNDLAGIAAEMAQTQGELVRIFPELTVDRQRFRATVEFAAHEFTLTTTKKED